MPLQNRVDPFGQIHAVAARGGFTGNRGAIHDPATKTLLKRRWTTRAWIICDCGFKGRRREVFGRNAPSGGPGWTNLFFLDEATALAAGHRPCFECRRERAKDFAGRFGIARPRAADIDARLHADRLASGGAAPPLTMEETAGLPDGSMVAIGEKAFALAGGKALPWSFTGYGAPVRLEDLAGAVRLVTPRSTVAALRAGYRPAWAPLT